MKKIIYAILMVCLCTPWVGCDEMPIVPLDSTTTGGPDPSNIRMEKTDETSVRIMWRDNSDDETGFAVWVRNATDVHDSEIAETVGANVTEYTVRNLSDGKLYYFGVQRKLAEGGTKIIWSDLLDMGNEAPGVRIIGEPVVTPASIALSYRAVLNMAGDKYGLCWSETGTPSIETDAFLYGPDIVPAPTSAPDGPFTAADPSAIKQVIPNIMLDYGKTYKVRAFVTTALGTLYSEEKEVSLAAAPDEITLTWNQLDKGLPTGVELYETTSQLNGDNFHAWYAVADLSGNVEVRVSSPAQWTPAVSIEDQAAALGADCHVLVNGTYFAGTGATGYTLIDGAELEASHIWWVAGSMGRVATDPKYSADEGAKSYRVTRATFGVDAAGTAGIYWTGTFPENNVAATRYYDRPMPQIVGESAVYGVPGTTNPCPPVSWTPRYALGAGPMLVYDGKIPFDFTPSGNGMQDSFLNNYELIAYDIFDPAAKADRTAIGIREDGKVILFVCDGRIASSPGPNILELARIMKGLGCVKAINLDGGNSTGMIVKGERINDATPELSRAIRTTIGFFKKQ